MKLLKDVKKLTKLTIKLSLSIFVGMAKGACMALGRGLRLLKLSLSLLF